MTGTSLSAYADIRVKCIHRWSWAAFCSRCWCSSESPSGDVGEGTGEVTMTPRGFAVPDILTGAPGLGKGIRCLSVAQRVHRQIRGTYATDSVGRGYPRHVSV